MKKITTLVLISVLFLVANQTIAQNLIAVQNGNSPRFFQQVDDAIVNAVDGDTLYIPGGSWNLTQPINKRLHLIGVGHHPDSTKVTFPTTLLGSLNLAVGASNGSITGIYIQGGMSTASDSPVNYYTLSRCRIADIYLNAQNSNFTYIENIIEGRIASSLGGNSSAKDCSFFNNIISAFFKESFPFTNSVLKNNIFLSQSQCYYGCYYPISGQYLLLENNIFSGSFYYSNTLSLVSNSVLKYNIFLEYISFPYATNVGLNNIVGQSQSSIFVNQSGNAFDYTHDYHLQPNSPGKNAGTDGTDIGIYGGIYPWKEGSIPSNPHFQSVQIAPKTDTNGNLSVKIKVAAQDH